MDITDSEKDEIINEINHLKRRTLFLQKLINEPQQKRIITEPKHTISTTFKSRSIC